MKRFAVMAIVLATTVAPAHAISHAYRAKLEREHKTQVQEIREDGHQRGPKMKPIHVKAEGIDFKRGTDGIAYINGKAAAHDESTPEADAYTSGLITVVAYTSGKINAMEDGRFIGRMK